MSIFLGLLDTPLYISLPAISIFVLVSFWAFFSEFYAPTSCEVSFILNRLNPIRKCTTNTNLSEKQYVIQLIKLCKASVHGDLKQFSGE